MIGENTDNELFIKKNTKHVSKILKDIASESAGYTPPMAFRGFFPENYIQKVKCERNCLPGRCFISLLNSGPYYICWSGHFPVSYEASPCE